MIETIFALLKADGLNDNLSTWALAQSAHETGNFSSQVFKKDNNCFGMIYAGQAIATRSDNNFKDNAGKIYYYAHYNSINDSVRDFVNWYSKHRNNIFSLPLFISDLKDYVHFLKNQHYFEADETEYFNGCNYYFSKYFKTT